MQILLAGDLLEEVEVKVAKVEVMVIAWVVMVVRGGGAQYGL